MDWGSPNTAWVTQAFFQGLQADLSFARVRRPTDNAITERFYGSLKQYEINVVDNYPDERSAREEIRRYIEDYNERRPHQSLMNCTPGSVHRINNKPPCGRNGKLGSRWPGNDGGPTGSRRLRLSQRKKRGMLSGMAQEANVEYRPNMEGVLSGKESKRSLPSQRKWNPLKATHP